MGLRIHIVLLVFCLYFVFVDALSINPIENDENYESEVPDSDTLDEPICSKPCKNNGHCVQPGVCECPKNTEGDYCEFNYNTKCKDLTSSKVMLELVTVGKNYTPICNKENDEPIVCKINCNSKHRIPGTYNYRVEFLRCVNEHWYLKTKEGKLIEPYCEALPAGIEEIVETEDELDQEPEEVPDNDDGTEEDGVPDIDNSTEPSSCASLCRNNGICSDSGECECPDNIDGKYCEFNYNLECKEFVKKQYNEQTYCYKKSGKMYCALTCFVGYKIPGTVDSNEKLLECINGEWSIKMDNGKLNDPYCEVLVKPECPLKPSLCKNATHTKLTSGSKTEHMFECVAGYSFPDGSKKQYLECVDGKWYNKLSGTSKAPDCEKDLNEKCVSAKDCRCVYDGLTFAQNYTQVRPGKNFLELCNCEGGSWNCSFAQDGDLQKYPSSPDLNIGCAKNPNSCKVKNPTTDCSEESSNYNNFYGNGLINKLINQYTNRFGNNLQKVDNAFDKNVADPSIKVMSLNLQSVEIGGDSK